MVLADKLDDRRGADCSYDDDGGQLIDVVGSCVGGLECCRSGSHVGINCHFWTTSTSGHVTAAILFRDVVIF